ncbi:MAG: hypothetical protein ACK2UA_19365 [Anaerolineae bacterium]|jgi:hypothetical protein
MKSPWRVHRFTPFWGIAGALIGISTTLLAIGAFVYNFGDLTSGNLTLLDYAGLFLVVPFMFCSGVYFCAMVIVTKIVTSPQGLEYHTMAYVVRIDWEEIKKLPKDEILRRRDSRIQPREIDFPQIAPRRWTEFVKLNARKQAIDRGIPLYQFGGYRGRRLLAEIRKYAPHLGL